MNVSAPTNSVQENLYEAAVDESGALVLGSQRISLGQLPPTAVTPGRPVIVGVRPEDLALCPDGTPGALSAEIRAVERLGSELHAFFSIDASSASGPAAATAPEGALPLGTGPLGTGPKVVADADADAGLPGTAHNGVARLDPRAAVRPGIRVTLRVDPARL